MLGCQKWPERRDVTEVHFNDVSSCADRLMSPVQSSEVNQDYSVDITCQHEEKLWQFGHLRH